MCSPHHWSFYKGIENNHIEVSNKTDISYIEHAELTVKFISRQFEEESVLNGTVTT